MRPSGYKLTRYPKTNVDGEAITQIHEGEDINTWWTQTQVLRVTGMKPAYLKRLAANGAVRSIETTRSHVYKPADVVAALEKGEDNATD